MEINEKEQNKIQRTGKYSIGYKDRNNDFIKVWYRGEAMKFLSVEEAEKFARNYFDFKATNIRIMRGWKVIKEVNI